MIAAQLTIAANTLTEVYIAEVFVAEAIHAEVMLCNESASHWVDIDVILAHGATHSTTVDAPVREETATRRYLYRGYSMHPTMTKRIDLALRHGDTVFVKASTANVSCTVVAEELVTPRALQAMENRLDALVEDVLNKQAIADATTGEEAVARSNTRLVRHPLIYQKTINGMSSEESAYISLEYAERVESLLLQASSVTGTADVKAEFATSWDTTSFDSYDDHADITSSTATDRSNNAEGMNVFSVSAPLNRYIKVRITGVNLNPTDTLVTAYLIVREGYA